MDICIRRLPGIIRRVNLDSRSRIFLNCYRFPERRVVTRQSHLPFATFVATPNSSTRSSSSSSTMSRPYRSARQKMLSAVAKETKDALPSILYALPDIKAPTSSIHALDELPELKAEDCPRFKLPSGEDGITTEVVNDDTLDTAIRLSKEDSASPSRVCVLNLASDKNPGGGWLGGALAQEESICYRTSLYMSLYRRYYPMPATSAIYSPDVVIIRDAFGAGHQLSKKNPEDLDVVSVVSVAALRRPDTSRSQETVDGKTVEHDVFAKPEDREMTKQKMRLTLRVAAIQGHTRLVLGALGCGAFKNPTEDVAFCWREVLGETEFAAGWFERVVFAVLDKGSDGKNAGRAGEGNFGTFDKLLGGVAFAEGRDPVKVVGESS